MELKHIKELMAAMGRTGTKRISLKKESFELMIERNDHPDVRFPEHQIETSDEVFKPSSGWTRADQALSRGSEMPGRSAYSPIPSERPKEDVASVYITSPMVGTFYSSPSPDDPSFIKVGDKVEKNRVVCIIEAMKVMNEIKTHIAGTVVEVLVDSGQPVEFGTKLFRIIE